MQHGWEGTYETQISISFLLHKARYFLFFLSQQLPIIPFSKAFLSFFAFPVSFSSSHWLQSNQTLCFYCIYPIFLPYLFPLYCPIYLHLYISCWSLFSTSDFQYLPIFFHNLIFINTVLLKKQVTILFNNEVPETFIKIRQKYATENFLLPCYFEKCQCVAFFHYENAPITSVTK